MRPNRPISTAMLVALVLCVVFTPLASLRAQTATVTITLSIPTFSEDLFSPKLLGDFESTHPGIKLNVVKNSPDIPAAAQGLDKHFDALQKYASSADVLYVSSSDISDEATRAGYFLDLSPLVSEDKTIKADDFFPPIWQSFQWDQGIWALPVGADTYVLSYNPDAFDKAGLGYPNDKWTVEDLTNAIRTLAVKGPDGKVTKPGMDLLPFYQGYLFRALLNTDTINSSTVPNTPKFASPQAADLLTNWLKLENDGYIGADLSKAPLSIAQAITVAFQGQLAPGEKRAGALLPGGVSAIGVEAFAVSGGTQYPEQAFAVAAWLTTRGELANDGLSTSPARKSLVGGPTSDQTPFTLKVSPEIQALIDKSLANAIPLSKMRFVDYLAAAYNKMKTDNVDAMTALQQAESDAVKAQQAAAAKKDTIRTALVVATPAPSGDLAAGKVRLKFGFGAGLAMQTIPNKEAWDRLIADFAAHDPNVTQITMELNGNALDKAAQQYDCFYLPYNALSDANLNKILPLDPLLSADSTFDKSDIIGNIMPQLQLNNKTWALPSDIKPNVLKYDPVAFDKAGVVVPGLDWTTTQFNDTLKQLKPDAKAPPVFIPQNTFGSYILTLITAYGGLPLDYRTTPITVSFADPATVDAVRQVGDLIKAGYIKYHPLFSTQLDVVLVPEKSAILQDTLSDFAFHSPLDLSKTDAYKMTLYPHGSQHNAISYQIGAYYISASTPNPEACYRWISLAARTSGLIKGMPVRHSALNDPALVAQEGADAVAIYKQVETLLQDPKTIGLPSFSNGTSLSEVLLQLELFQAMDKYILKDVDLESALKDADISAKAYQGCAVNLPHFDQTSVESQKAFLKAFKDCAIKADQSLKPFFDAIAIN